MPDSVAAAREREEELPERPNLRYARGVVWEAIRSWGLFPDEITKLAKEMAADARQARRKHGR